MTNQNKQTPEECIAALKKMYESIFEHYYEYCKYAGEIKEASIFPAIANYNVASLFSAMSSRATSILVLIIEFNELLFLNGTELKVYHAICCNRKVIDDIRTIIIGAEQNRMRL